MTAQRTYAPVTQVLVDEKTQDELGQDGLSLAGARMWLGDCQSCNRPLSPDDPPSLVAATFGPWVEMSLHHPDCRHPQWCDRFIIEVENTSTYVFMPFTLPMPEVAPWPIPHLLINPTVERVRLVRTGRDAAAPWQVRRPIESGFRSTSETTVGQPHPDAEVYVRRAAPSSIEVLVGGVDRWRCDLDESSMGLIDTAGGMLILAGNSISPSYLDDPEFMNAYLKAAASNDLLDAAWAPLVT